MVISQNNARKADFRSDTSTTQSQPVTSTPVCSIPYKTILGELSCKRTYLESLQFTGQLTIVESLQRRKYLRVKIFISLLLARKFMSWFSLS
jgi:hypothetical protein